MFSRRHRFVLVLTALTAAASAAAALTVPSPAQAQNSLRIAATVNDEMVSVYDIDSRMRLAIFLSKLPDTIETKKRLAPQILRGIIDDKLRMQEAKRLELSVSRPELQSELAVWEARSGLSKGDADRLAKRLGIDKATILEQVETAVAWRKVIRTVFLRSARVSDQEVDEILAGEEKLTGQPEYLVSEIFLPFDQRQQNDQVLGLANRLIQQIRSGANFGAVARNFSQSPTAAVGGSLGWHRIGQLSPELDKVVRGLNPGQVSQPIQSLDGVYVLQLQGKRAIQPFLEKSGDPETVTLHQVHFALPPGAKKPEVIASLNQASERTRGVGSCAAMEALGTQAGTQLSGPLGKFPVAELSPNLRKLVVGLPNFTPSAPFVTAGGVSVVMVCERTEPKMVKVDRNTVRDRIRSRLTGERLNLASRQFLRSLRRAAIVDVRI